MRAKEREREAEIFTLHSYYPNALAASWALSVVSNTWLNSMIWERGRAKEKKRGSNNDVCVFCVFDVLLSANWADRLRSLWVRWFVFEEAALNLRGLLILQSHVFLAHNYWSLQISVCECCHVAMIFSFEFGILDLLMFIKPFFELLRLFAFYVQIIVKYDFAKHTRWMYK